MVRPNQTQTANDVTDVTSIGLGFRGSEASLRGAQAQLGDGNFTLTEVGAMTAKNSPRDIQDVPRRPASGTMARVAMQPKPAPELVESKTPPALDTSHDLPNRGDDDDSPHEEETTRISSPLRMVSAGMPHDDEESTREFVDVTRVMPPPSDSASSVLPRSERRPTSHTDDQPTSTPSVVVADDSRSAFAVPATLITPPTPVAVANVAYVDPLKAERALLRAITSPRVVVPPVVAIRPAPPSPRMLAIVATFSALGLLWVMAVAAMVVVLVTR